MEKRFYYFNIGRGGMHKNPNHKEFVGLVSESEITKHLTHIERGQNGKFLNIYIDDSGHEIISQKDLNESIKKGFVVLDFDTIYDTDIYLTVDRLDENDIRIIENSYNSFDAKEALDRYYNYHNIEQ